MDDSGDCSYLNSQYGSNWSVPFGDVEYWDFSNQKDNSSVAPSLPIVNDYTHGDNSAFIPLVGDDYLADDDTVSKNIIYLNVMSLVFCCCNCMCLVLVLSDTSQIEFCIIF